MSCTPDCGTFAAGGSAHTPCRRAGRYCNSFRFRSSDCPLVPFFFTQVNDLLALIHLKAADVSLLFGQRQLAGQPLVGLGPAHPAALPEVIKDLVGLPPLEPQHLIGHVAQGTVGPLMAAYPGVAVLAEVDVLTSQPKPVGGSTINLPGRHQADHTSAVTADGGNFHLCPPPYAAFFPAAGFLVSFWGTDCGAPGRTPACM